MPTLRLANTTIEIGHKPLIMGIVNATPDSFSGDGLIDPQQAIDHARALIKQGADILDIGGESSKPGSDPVSVSEEQRRIMPVIEALVADSSHIPISVDTYHPKTAEMVLKAGITIINDITGLASDEIAQLVAQYHAGIVIMHMQGRPKTMQHNPHYDNVVEEIKQFFRERIEKAHAAGIGDDQIILDPGFGFGKTVEHNIEIIRRISDFKTSFEPNGYEYPVLLGVSRKTSIGKLTGKDDPKDRVFGSAAAVALSVTNGASIIRTHDVAAMKDVIAVTTAIGE